MAILRPTQLHMQEISLESEDGDITLPSMFMSSNGFSIFRGDNYVFECEPIQLHSVFDPDIFLPLVDYFLAQQIDPQPKKFTLTQHVVDKNAKKLQGLTFQAKGCELYQLHFLEADRSSSEPVTLSVTLIPGEITRIKG
jgi:hypothetical protein